MVKLDTLRLGPPMQIPKAAMQFMANMLTEHGQGAPLRALPDGTILTGNVRYQAMVGLGWKEGEVIFVGIDEL